MDLNLQIRTLPMGKDTVFLISGGQAHIGATAIAYPTEVNPETLASHARGSAPSGNVRVESISVPGHREEQLSAELAQKAASILGQTVTVVMGIHIDHATKQDIGNIVQAVRGAMDQELARILSRKT